MNDEIVVLGIDPGLSGAISVIKRGKVAAVFDIPVMAKTYGKGNMVDGAALFACITNVALDATHVFIEQVQAMPKQGVSSMFTFGRSLGAVEGVLAGFNIGVQYVTPRKWKGVFNLVGKTIDKDRARTIVRLAHPEIADQLTRKKDIGRADAILIGKYGFSILMAERHVALETKLVGA